MSRFTRQIRLVDVGEAGQARLEAARVAPRTEGFARSVEETYLRAAGVGLGPGAPAAGSTAPDLGLRHAAAREVADGAYAALVAMRRVLGVGGPS
ncbi:MAG: hypothetical protein U0270_35675 [Labilithrix sp.]